MPTREHERLAEAVRLGRVAAMPGADLLRVRTTKSLMER